MLSYANDLVKLHEHISENISISADCSIPDSNRSRVFLFRDVLPAFPIVQYCIGRKVLNNNWPRYFRWGAPEQIICVPWDPLVLIFIVNVFVHQTSI